MTPSRSRFVQQLDRVLLLAAVVPLVLTMAWSTTFEWSDNGLPLMAADAVLHGLRPYRDFHWHYLPGAPYLFGGLEALAGRSYIVVRGVFVLAVIATVALSLRLVRNLSGRTIGWVAFAALVPCVSWRPLLNHAVLEPLAGVATALLLIRARERGGLGHWLLVGVPPALLALFNHLAGPVLLFGAAIGLLLAQACSPVSERLRSGAVLRALVLMGVPLIVLVGLVVAVCWLQGCLGTMYDWTTSRLLGRYVGSNAQTNIFDLDPVRRSAAAQAVLGGDLALSARNIRLFALAIVMRILPFASAAAALALILGKRGRAALDPALLRRVALVCGVGLALYLESFKGWKQGANDVASLIPLIVLGVVVQLWPWIWPRRLMVAALLGTGALAFTFIAGQSLATVRMWRRMPIIATSMGGLRSPNLDEADFRRRVLDAIRAHPEARSIFSYYYEPAIYPLTQLRPVSPYRYFTLTLTGEPDFISACQDLRRDPADLVLRDADWDVRPGAPIDNPLEKCVSELYVVEREIPSLFPGHPYKLMIRRPR
jgi:hypothetical protein